MIDAQVGKGKHKERVWAKSGSRSIGDFRFPIADLAARKTLMHCSSSEREPSLLNAVASERGQIGNWQSEIGNLVVLSHACCHYL